MADNLIKRKYALILLNKPDDNIELNNRVDNQNCFFDEYGNYFFPTDYSLNNNTVYSSSEGFAYINMFISK